MDLANYVPDAHIVRGIVDLVHGLGKRVIAEGVETTGGLAFLLGVGCDVGQGYHWTHPLPASDLILWLEGITGTSCPTNLSLCVHERMRSRLT